MKGHGVKSVEPEDIDHRNSLYFRSMYKLPRTYTVTSVSQLANLTLQLHEIKKGKEVAQELWCTKCKGQGHTKDNCLVFVEYLSSGNPNPLVQNQGPWCELCRTRGHRPHEFPYFRSMYKPLRTYIVTSVSQ